MFRAGEALRDGGAGGTPHRGANWGDDPPAISGGLVYFGSNDGYLHGLDAQSGQEKWRFETGHASSVASYPAVSGGMVYFGGHLPDPDDFGGYLYAVK